MGANGGESRVIDILADEARHFSLLAFPRRERTPPLPERPVAIGDRREAHMGSIIEQRNRRLEQAIGKALLEVGECQQTLAKLRAVAQEEVPHTTQFVGALAALDR